MVRYKTQLLVTALLLLFSGWVVAATELDTILATADEKIAAGDFDTAKKILDSAIESSPQSSKLHQKIAAVHMIQREYSLSIPHFQKAIGLDSKNGGAFIGLGFAYLHSGRYGPARAALLEAQSLTPHRATEIQQIISWIDDRSQPEQADYEHSSESMPDSIKAAMGHNNN